MAGRARATSLFRTVVRIATAGGDHGYGDMMDEWRVTVGVSDGPGELQELLGGVELDVGSEWRDGERTERIASVESFGVGYDVYCMFGFVNVICESDTRLVLYTDGAIHDVDDVPIGRHDLTLRTVDGRRSLAKKGSRT
jgi:hypothetical protein